MVSYTARARTNLRLKAAPNASNPNSPISGIGLAVFGSSAAAEPRSRYQRFRWRRCHHLGYFDIFARGLHCQNRRLFQLHHHRLLGD